MIGTLKNDKTTIGELFDMSQGEEGCPVVVLYTGRGPPAQVTVCSPTDTLVEKRAVATKNEPDLDIVPIRLVSSAEVNTNRTIVFDNNKHSCDHARALRGNIQP